MTDIKHTNRLINETSPYLLQHAHNPVDWYPWGQEALDRAKIENKPIFLSIGYSACHWCHVMEHESFENENIAAQLNGSFISIKVDREERPDLDAIYMEAIQALTGSGGWPLTIFLTPELKPFYGGTYFPPEDRHGLPGLIRVLDIVATAYQDRRDEIERVAGEIVEYLKKSLKVESNQDILNSDMIHGAYNNIRASFDTVNGGFGTAPKFPQSMILEFLLRFHYRTGDKEALQMVEKTLDKMAAGGIYDHIGGGFHRYSVDDRWLVPHFEKMLYDNALLSRVYLHAYQVTSEVYYRSVVEETLDYIQRDMRDKEGGFYSAQDADSEGVEGKYYIWTSDEINYVLGIKEAEIFTEFYGVSTSGNFEGKNILNKVTKMEDIAQKHGLQVQDIEERIRLSKKKLLQKRFQRIPPLRDEKSLTGWNALMMAAFAEASMVFNRKDYLEVAIDCGEFIIRSLYKDKVLKHSFKDTKTGEDGFLQDYAFVCEAYLLLYKATFESKWFTMSLETAKIMVNYFWDPDIKTFYDTDNNVQSLIMRPRTIYDNAVPSGMSSASMVLLYLSKLTEDKDFENIAVTAIQDMQYLMQQYPVSFGNWLCAADFYFSESLEMAIIGDLKDSETESMMKMVSSRYRPSLVIAVNNPKFPTEGIPLIKGIVLLNNKPTAYVCTNNVCLPPVVDADGLSTLLDKGS